MNNDGIKNGYVPKNDKEKNNEDYNSLFNASIEEYFKNDYPDYLPEDAEISQPENPQPSVVNPKKPDNRQKKNLFVTIIAAVAVFLVIILVVAIKGCSSGKDTDNMLFKQGLTNVSDSDGRYGYIDEDGEKAIEFEYDFADDFSENGLAVVGLYDEKTGWEYGYINKKGEYVITPKFKEARAFGDNGLALVCKNEKYGFIDKHGKFVIEPDFEYAYGFVDDYAIVVKYGDERKCGYIDKKGEFVIDYKYSAARPFVNGYAAVCDDDKWGYINKKGEFIIEPEYDLAADFDDNGFAMIREDGKWGVIDKKGNVIVSAKYDDIYSFSDNGLAAVCKKGKWGYINTKGDIVIECSYESATTFSDDGVAAVCDDGKWGFINKKGIWVVEPHYDYIVYPDTKYYSFMDEYKYELGSVFVDGKAVVEKSGDVYIVDKNGKEKELDDIDYVSSTHNDYIVFCEDSNYGAMNWNGEIIIDAVYDYIG